MNTHKMQKILLIALTVLITSCTGKTATDNDSSKDVTNSDTLQEVSAQVNSEDSGREGYTFKTSFRKDENGQYDALILTCQKGEKTQEFVCEFNWAKGQDWLGESGTIEEEDINFDGTPDVVVCLGNFGVGDSYFFYDALVWNNNAECFEKVEEYSSIANPVIDTEKKIIVSQYTNMENTTYREEYAWKDGKLAMIDSSSESSNDAEEE